MDMQTRRWKEIGQAMQGGIRDLDSDIGLSRAHHHHRYRHRHRLLGHRLIVRLELNSRTRIIRPASNSGRHRTGPAWLSIIEYRHQRMSFRGTRTLNSISIHSISSSSSHTIQELDQATIKRHKQQPL